MVFTTTARRGPPASNRREPVTTQSTNLEGPWSPAKPLSTPGSNNSWDSQVDFVYPIQGTKETLYMYAGDRWIKDAAHGRNGDYVWLPMEFDGDMPIVNYYQDWELNLAAGTWRKFDPSRNLVAGKPVTASSDEGTNVAKHVTEPKSYADYFSSYWESARHRSAMDLRRSRCAHANQPRHPQVEPRCGQEVPNPDISRWRRLDRRVQHIAGLIEYDHR